MLLGSWREACALGSWPKGMIGKEQRGRIVEISIGKESISLWLGTLFRSFVDVYCSRL